jgi:hypothetical protein
MSVWEWLVRAVSVKAGKNLCQSARNIGFWRSRLWRMGRLKLSQQNIDFPAWGDRYKCTVAFSKSNIVTPCALFILSLCI